MYLGLESAELDWCLSTSDALLRKCHLQAIVSQLNHGKVDITLIASLITHQLAQVLLLQTRNVKSCPISQDEGISLPLLDAIRYL